MQRLPQNGSTTELNTAEAWIKWKFQLEMLLDECMCVCMCVCKSKKGTPHEIFILNKNNDRIFASGKLKWEAIMIHTHIVKLRKTHCVYDKRSSHRIAQLNIMMFIQRHSFIHFVHHHVFVCTHRIISEIIKHKWKVKKTTKRVSLTILETIYPLTSTRYLRWFDVWRCVFFSLPLVFVIFFSHFISSVFFQHRKTNKRAKAIIIYNLLFLRTVWVCSFEMKQQQWSSSSLSWWRWMEKKKPTIDL